jgi:hypothetical protein
MAADTRHPGEVSDPRHHTRDIGRHGLEERIGDGGAPAIIPISVFQKPLEVELIWTRDWENPEELRDAVTEWLHV